VWHAAKDRRTWYDYGRKSIGFFSHPDWILRLVADLTKDAFSQAKSEFSLITNE
jgi:hypothetical protein